HAARAESKERDADDRVGEIVIELVGEDAGVADLEQEDAEGEEEYLGDERALPRRWSQRRRPSAATHAQMTPAARRRATSSALRRGSCCEVSRSCSPTSGPRRRMSPAVPEILTATPRATLSTIAGWSNRRYISPGRSWGCASSWSGV